MAEMSTEIESEIRRINSNLLSYYDSCAEQLIKNYKIFRAISFGTISLAIGVTIFSGYAALNLGFFDRIASIAAVLCGLLITSSQLFWSRSRFPMQSATHRAICIAVKTARSEINRRLILLHELDPQKQMEDLKALLDYVVEQEKVIHNLQLGLTEIPDRIDGLEGVTDRPVH
jgi:hypothetical protein